MKIEVKTDVQKLLRLSRATFQAAQTIEDDSPKELEYLADQVEVRARLNALRTLPQRGGLAGEIASSDFSRKKHRAGRTTTITVTASSEYDLAGINEGTLIHPTYGHRPWLQQSVQSGWFTDPLDEIERELVSDIEKLVHRAISIIR